MEQEPHLWSGGVIMLTHRERIEFRDKSGGILRVICLPQSNVVRAKAA